MPKSRSKKMPPMGSIEELITFFDTHDMGDYWEQMPTAHFESNIKNRRHLIAIDEELVGQLNEIAKIKKMPSEKLVNSWLKEKLRETA